MKNVQKVVKENKGITFVSILMLLAGCLATFIDEATFIGISTNVIQWCSIILGVLTFVITYIKSNFESNEQ